MDNKISRRDFIKLSGLGAAAAILTGCGPLARYELRRPYATMPEYNYTGKFTYYATACSECPAGCGVLVKTQEGRARIVVGNPNHPINKGKICARGTTSNQGLYNPDRYQFPGQHPWAGSPEFKEIKWEDGIKTVQSIFQNTEPGAIAFMVGLTPDHIYDLATDITTALGASAPLRIGALGMFEARYTLVKASEAIFNKANLPFFDLANADVTFSFGANFLEDWISPLAYSRGYGNMRQGTVGKRGRLIMFEPRQSLTSGNADEWYPVVPGSEGLVALAISKLVADKKGDASGFGQVDLDAAAKASGMTLEQFNHLAELFVTAEHPLVIPGGAALASSGGLAAAKAILGLNAMVGNLGQPGGVFLTENNPDYNSLAVVEDLVKQMKAGKVKALFIHGCNPVFELPAGLNFASALKNVPQVISFASFPDETSQQSTTVLPDNTMLESWGYQRILAGADRPAYSAFQPVVVPLYSTHATADVLLAAVQAVGGTLAAKVPYKDEVEFIQSRLVPLVQSGQGFYNPSDMPTFWTEWLQYGGWWTKDGGLEAPQAQKLTLVNAAVPAPLAENSFHLYAYPTQLGDGHLANRPWIQETPDPMTTAMWNSWVEINPQTAAKLGIKDNDVVKLTSSVGEVEGVAYLYPAIRPDTLGVPFGQGHTALGQYAVDRGFNPAALMSLVYNEAGDLALYDQQVKITPTGKTYNLARMESREGVYGTGNG